MQSEIALCHRIAANFDQLADLLREHEESYGELLPYMFVGDVGRWYVMKWRDHDPVVTPFAKWLEQEYIGGDDGTQNVIGVSFLEHLPGPSRRNPSDVADTFGPVLRDMALYLRQGRSD